MQDIDLNLIPVLLTLLEEQHVTRAASRLHLSIPATSRALERARHTFGDPLLVRHGRGVVMTPAAEALLPRLSEIVESISALLTQTAPLDTSKIRGTFAIRCNEAVTAAIGTKLVETVRREAPHAELRFEVEAADDLAAIKRGDVALGIGSYSETSGDIDREHLLTEHLVGVVRSGHPLLQHRITLRSFAELDHIVVSRRGRRTNVLDQQLADRGLARHIAVVVPSFSAALAIAIQSDATTVAPRQLATIFAGAGGITLFAIPGVRTHVDIEQIWHARYTGDPVHQWLRGCVARAAGTLREKSQAPLVRRTS